MKYSLRVYDITPSYLEKIIDRMEAFRTVTNVNTAIHLTFVTINGVKHNAQWGIIQNEVTADQLFEN